MADDADGPSIEGDVSPTCIQPAPTNVFATPRTDVTIASGGVVHPAIDAASRTMTGGSFERDETPTGFYEAARRGGVPGSLLGRGRQTRGRCRFGSGSGISRHHGVPTWITAWTEQQRPDGIDRGRHREPDLAAGLVG
jgi:hypothetical protein